jgi:hypothetical protein
MQQHIDPASASVIEQAAQGWLDTAEAAKDPSERFYALVMGAYTRAVAPVMYEHGLQMPRNELLCSLTNVAAAIVAEAIENLTDEGEEPNIQNIVDNFRDAFEAKLGTGTYAGHIGIPRA